MPAPPTQQMASPDTPTNGNQALLDQIAELRAQVALLQAKTEQKTSGQAGMKTGGAPSMGMDGMEKTSAMGPGMMDSMGKMMGGMGAMGPAAGVPPTASGMPAAGMAQPANQDLTPPPAGKSASTGSSSLYQMGSKDFFLDQSEQITLTAKQNTALIQIKEHALSNQVIARERMGQAEKEFWFLTSAESPDAAAIKVKVRQIEKQRGDMRIDFIDHVGKATEVLTIEQRHILLGKMPSQKK